jgi:hypothetical protein
MFTGLCLLLGGCSGNGTSADDGDSLAGSANMGIAGSLDSGGAAPTAGAPAAGGAPSATAGAGDSGGAVATGGAPAGGQGGSSMGGGGSSGASAGADAGAGVGGQGGATAAAIDFSIWSLQLPTGSGNSPTTIAPKELLAGFSNDYFYLSKIDGGQMFMDPEQGITTPGSLHCRTEMRENKPGGGQAAWASSGTNTMTVSGKVIMVGGGAGGTVAVGQLFNGTDSIPLIELMYSTSKKGFLAFYEEAKSQGVTTDVQTPVALNTKYTFILSLTKGVATVTINGKVVFTKTPSAGILAKSFYFKFGNYDQGTSYSTTVSKTPYTVVEAYTADVVHK